MKKYLFLFIVIINCVSVTAQNNVEFHLQADGTFVGNDGKDFKIVEYEGKSAIELYNMIKQNIIELYKDPKKVMTENEPTSIKVRALSEPIYSGMALIGGLVTYRAYYDLVFHFKEGRIKVDAPLIEQRLDNSDSFSVNAPSKTFVGYIDDWFDKKGKPKKNKEEKIARVENILLAPINIILESSKSQTANENENW